MMDEILKFGFGILIGYYSTIFLMKKVNLLESEDKLRVKKKNIKRFPILKLPALVMHDVIKLMDLDERVELALSSERMKQNVQAARAKTVYTMNIRERGTNIKLDPGGIQVFCGIKSWNFAPEWYERNGFSLGHWLNRPNPRQSVFQNLITNFERLKQLTPPSFLIINCYIDLMKNVTIRQVIDTPELQNWDQIYFYGIENTGEAWKWINEISMRPELRVDFDCDWIMVEKRFCKVPEF